MNLTLCPGCLALSWALILKHTSTCIVADAVLHAYILKVSYTSTSKPSVTAFTMATYLGLALHKLVQEGSEGEVPEGVPIIAHKGAS